MSKSAKVALLAVLGIALLVSGFSGGFVAGHFLPLGWGGPAGTSPVVPVLPAPAADSATPPDLANLFKPFWEAWQLAHTQFVDQPVDDTTLMQGAIRGMIDSLGDRQSSYMDPSTYEMANAGLEGSYEGIGAIVDTSGAYLTIISTFPASPAETAGLHSGDKIIGLDKEDLKGVDPEVVRQKVKGPAGTSLHLTIARAGETAPLEFDITRARITTDAVTSKMLTGGIAYIKIPTFGSDTTRELIAALRTLTAQKPRGLILDLRDNGGGYLETAVEVVSQFQGSGVVLYEEYGDGRRKPYNVIQGGLATKIPMVVLVNEGSASASEITAGALQDYGRATAVGVTSYGKGSVQNWIPVSNDQGAVRITIARWLTPNDRQIDAKGLTPDVYVPITDADRAAGRDPQMDAAVDTLERVIAGRPIPTSIPTPVPTVMP